MKRLRMWPLLVIALAMVTTGCGSSGGGTSTGGGTSSNSSSRGGLTQAELQRIIDQIKAINNLPRAPQGAPGVNGLANAPTDPASGDAAEANFDRFIFHEVASFWRDTERQPVSARLTFQPVDSSNNPAPCVVSDKQTSPQSIQADQIGPFYCRDDGTGKPVIYWPLASIFSLPNGTIPSYGAFAEADAIAHEFGHYMQDLTGYLASSQDAASAASDQGEDRTAALWSQDIELQADCLAGDWVRSQWDQNLITQDDLNQAGTLTFAVGDDAIDPLNIIFPRQGAHGTSEQRVRWLNVGIRSGRPADCYTWNEPLYGAAAGE